MRLTGLTGVVVLTAAAAGRELPVDELRAAELYDSGVVHQKIMDHKIVSPPPPGLGLPWP